MEILTRTLFKEFLIFIPLLFTYGIYKLFELDSNNSFNVKEPKVKIQPMKQPLKGPALYTTKINRIIIYDNRYFQHQLKKNCKWILHNTNGPAVVDSLLKRSSFFINGVEYENEFQYLVAKGDYENDKNNL